MVVVVVVVVVMVVVVVVVVVYSRDPRSILVARPHSHTA